MASSSEPAMTAIASARRRRAAVPVFSARAALFAALAFTLAGTAVAQEPQTAATTTFTPELGMPGKDVIWLPTSDALMTAMLDAAQVKPGELVIDLGSGDGRIPIAAARDYGARARGIEYNPDLVKLSRENAVKAGVADKVEFIEGDIFKLDWSTADVLTLYLLPELNLQIREDVLSMKPGTRVVSNAFAMGDWKADRVLKIDGRTAYFWVVPANLRGVWRVSMPGRAGLTLMLDQKHQAILSATARRGGRTIQVKGATVSGPELTLALVGLGDDLSVRARLENGVLRGEARTPSGQVFPLTARRRSERF